MPRRDDDVLYAGLSIEGPLFAMEPVIPAPGPFDDSREKPTSEEISIASIIWKHQGRATAVNIATLAADLGIDPRSVKDTVQRLRQTHRCRIGLDRGTGYYWIVDDADRALAVRGMRSQIKAMFDTLLVIDTRSGLCDLVGELRGKL